MEGGIVMASPWKGKRMAKNTLQRVPNSSHDPNYKAEAVEVEKANRKHGNRHDRRKAAALARQMAKGPT